MTQTVQLKGASKSYRGTTALKDVDLNLPTGIVGLLGPNGAGKTTLLRILATVLGADHGSVRILGLDPAVREQRTSIRRQLGYLPQEIGYPRGFSVYGFVDYIAVLKEIEDPTTRRAEVRRVLEQVGLADRSTKRIRTLSGGQRRRVALAQCLLGNPRLLVLDEPTTGLDPEQRVLLRHVLAEVGRSATVVIATHQTEDVEALCERVVVLDEGRVHFDGAVKDIVTKAANGVWVSASPDPRATTSWRTASGAYRNIAETAPDGAELVTPSLEDAYLLLRASTRASSEEAA